MTANPSPAPAESVPSVLESTTSKLVYLYLRTEEEATVDAIAHALDLRKLALFGVLSRLESEGYVERDGPRTVRFSP